MMIDLKKLWEAMPRDVQRKISCHDLKRIVDNYNGDPPEMQGESEAIKWLFAKMKNALDAANLDSQNV